jgi:O-antigen ligase
MKIHFINKLQGFLLAVIIKSNVFSALRFPFNEFYALFSSLLVIIIGITLNYNSIIFNKKKSIVLFFLFFLTVTFSLLQAHSFYNINIYCKYIIIILLCLVSYFQNIDSIVFFLKTTVFLNIILAFVSFFNINFIVSNPDVNYLNCTYSLGISYLIILVSIFYKFNYKKLFILLLLFTAMFKYPSRGTLIFTVFLSFVLVYKNRPKKSKITKFLFFGLIVLLICLISWTIYFFLKDSYLFFRFLNLFANIGEEPRIAIYSKAFTAISQNFLFGVGIGNSGPALGSSLGVYPHNIFLEALIEFGLFGLLIFVLILIKYSKILIKASSLNNLGLILLYVFIYCFLIFQKSFSLIYSQYLLIPLFLSAALNRVDLLKNKIQ